VAGPAEAAARNDQYPLGLQRLNELHVVRDR
jgi:hypothetical protein